MVKQNLILHRLRCEWCQTVSTFYEGAEVSTELS